MQCKNIIIFSKVAIECKIYFDFKGMSVAIMFDEFNKT